MHRHWHMGAPSAFIIVRDRQLMHARREKGREKERVWNKCGAEACSHTDDTDFDLCLRSPLLPKRRSLHLLPLLLCFAPKSQDRFATTDFADRHTGRETASSHSQTHSRCACSITFGAGFCCTPLHTFSLFRGAHAMLQLSHADRELGDLIPALLCFLFSPGSPRFWSGACSPPPSFC